MIRGRGGAVGWGSHLARLMYDILYVQGVAGSSPPRDIIWRPALAQALFIPLPAPTPHNHSSWCGVKPQKLL